MRWSDGAPFSADDIMFWYDDIFQSAELTPSKNAIFVIEGKPVVVEKLDDYKVRFKFAAPYGLFLQQLAYGQGHIPIIYPKHYLKQFHLKYNKDGIDKMLAQSQTVKDWVSLFNSKVSLTFQPAFWQNTELPTLNPWVLTVPYGRPTASRCSAILTTGRSTPPEISSPTSTGSPGRRSTMCSSCC